MPQRSCATVVFWTLAALSLPMLPSLAVAQTPGLVAAYAFNETAGTTAADASGTGNNGVLTNGALFTAGKVGNGVGLDGMDDYIDLGNRTSLRITGSLTLSAWVKSSAFPFDDAAIVSKRQSSNIGYQLDTTVDRGPRTIGFKITNVSGSSVARYGATAMAANTWYHVAGVYNAANRTMAVYLSGQLDNGVLVGTVPATQRNSNQNVNLGQRPGSRRTFNFAGVLDDVRIYDRALSLAEIQADMLTPVGGAPASNTPPTISSIVAPAINEDTATGALSFTVGDLETPAGSLTVSGSSSNPTLVPPAGIVFGGSGANRTVRITPATNQNGIATITVTVSDGQLSTATSFLLTVNAVNDAPTITSIANQTTTAGTAVGPLSFTVNDVETAAGSLALTGSSSNQTLVPTGNIVFAGSGASRTVTITPAANQNGTATITVTVSDGQLSAATSFDLTVSALNTPPTISSIVAPAINEDTATGALSFTVGDLETPAGSLTVSGSSSNPTLVPPAGIVFGGSGANRTVRITPATNQNGTATITVTVSDGQLSTATSFLLTVNAVNDAPTISSIANQTTTAGTAVGPVSFAVSDVETAPGSLALTGSSSNQTLVPTGNIVFAGSGATRTVTITPAANQNGTATITVTVSDGQLSAATSFVLMVTQVAGLAAGWNFNEGTGAVAHDLSGNDNTASLSNPSAWTAGEYGGGLGFSGASFVTVPDSPSLDISGNALTLSMWVNPQPLAQGDDVLLAKLWNSTQTSPYYQYGIELDQGSAPRFFVGTAAGPLSAPMGSSLPFGQWNHLAVVFDGSQVRFYLNASLVSTQPIAATLTARGQQLNIGADANGSQLFNGTLDDVRIYPRVLTQAEIQADMLTPLGGVSGSDVTLPTVVISSPTNNSQVTDIVTITANAADDTAVAGVQFLVDGVNVGVEDTAAPYGVSWDTRAVTNGTHTLTARARDAAGNIAVSLPITVNVTNVSFFQNEILATGFSLPTSIKFLPDGRMLVVELEGTIKILPPPYTQADPTAFLQLTNVGSAGVQQGIYDIALDPDFVTNHFYYLFYTAGTPNRDRLSRFTANASITGTIAGSELVLYQDPQNANAEHHGGAVTFGNDGKIYFTTGEHFNAGDAQVLSSPRGKIHRINKDGTVPTDNPFYDGAGPNWDSIWALGLRNPFRAYYDVPTGRLIVGDVGGNDYSVAKEEVNIGVAGANYGWPNSEGPCSAPCKGPNYYYPHNGRDAAITGGFVYHGTQFPAAYQGSYFFADYAQNWIRRLTFDANGNVNGVFNFEPADDSVDGPYGDIVYLTEGPDGALYYVDLGYSDIGGTFGISKIRRIRYVQTNQAPVAVASAAPTKGPGPLTVSFSSNGSFDPEGQALSYEWTFGDGFASVEAHPTHTYAQNGQYTARLSVSDGANTTVATPLFISVGNPPIVAILSPGNGAFFRAGDVISVNGDATDAAGGILPATAFTWNIDFLHEGHVHPGVPTTGTKTGTFTIPTVGHDFSGNTRYRITLTVTDLDGLQSSQAVVVYPDKVDLSFDTAPTGLTLHLDGIARVTPFVYDTLIGFNHTIEAEDQTQAPTAYAFASWSDGGPQQHGIVVPATPQSYAATYTAAPIPLPQGLVAAWNFSEGAGASAGDKSGNGNTAALMSGTSWTVGRYDNGVSLDGIGNYLSVPNSPSLDISGTGLTLSMWIDPQPLNGGDSVVLGKFWNATMTSPYYQYGLELASGTEPFFYVGTNTGVLFARMGAGLAFNQWSHLAVVFNGSQAQFYVDGTLVSTQPLPAVIQARGRPLNIGADISPAQFHKGLLDEVRIYDRPLSPSEVQADMTTALQR